MPELTYTLIAKRDQEHQERKFMAAMQGVDLDAQDNENKGQKEWEDMKARVFSRGSSDNSNDIASLQGINAQQAGFGIGMGLEYQVVKDPKNPMS